MLILRGVVTEVLRGERTRANDAHLAEEDIEDLRHLVEFGLPEEVSDRQDPRVIRHGDVAATQIGAVLEHRGKLEQPEGFALPADALLHVENLALAGETQDQRYGQAERKKKQCGDEGKRYVQESFHHDSIRPGTNESPRRCRLLQLPARRPSS